MRTGRTSPSNLIGELSVGIDLWNTLGFLHYESLLLILALGGVIE